MSELQMHGTMQQIGCRRKWSWPILLAIFWIWLEGEGKAAEGWQPRTLPLVG